MNVEEYNNRQGNMNSPTWEEELVVELNFDLMKTIQSMQADLQSFKYDNMNEIKEKKAINAALLQNIMRGIPHGKPTHSTNKTKENGHHKWGKNPREWGKKEHTLELPEREYHSISSDNSLSPCRKLHKMMKTSKDNFERQRNQLMKER